MKIGDYLIVRYNSKRYITRSTWDNNTGKLLKTENIGEIEFIKNQKYLITDINLSSNILSIEYKKDSKLSFSIMDGKFGYECYDKIFQLDTTIRDRKEKLLKLKEISEL